MYRDILVPTDGSEGSEGAADHAIELALKHGATIHAVHVVPEAVGAWAGGSGVPIGDGPATEARLREFGREATERIRDRADRRNVPCITAVRSGEPHEEIVEYAREEDVDLVVMGTHGRTGLQRYLLGSVAERVVRTAPVPVLTLAPEAARITDADEARQAARETLEREGYDDVELVESPSQQRSTWVVRAAADGDVVNVHVDTDGHTRVAHLGDV